MSDQKTQNYSALVLEGGGMRGTFTAGVLDSFIDSGITFPYVIGTSAGASVGVSFVSRQRGRTRFSNIDLLALRPYIGLRHLLAGRGVIDLDFLFNEYPQRYYPFDFEAYRNSGVRFVATATNAETGEAEYLEEMSDFERFTAVVRASCSLPVLCPMGRVDGRFYVDGGVSDSIPVRRALADGNDRCVVVLTQKRGFRKPLRQIRLPWFVYRRFPRLKNALRFRNLRYNSEMDFIEQLEASGRLLVVRPSDTFGVGRCTSDAGRLAALYDEGIRAGIEASALIAH